MGTLIEDVLALARLGGQVVDEEPVRLPRLVRRTWSSVGDTSSRLVVGDVDTVVGDERRLERLFENLFRNAVEHGSTSPDSQARQDAVEHGSTSPGSQAHQDAVEHGDPGVTVRVGPTEEGFFVADDGPGIPEDEREDVFDSGYTTADDGTGFGLAIVAEIVDAHDGEITVTESTEGGACFEITGIEVR
jgi:signal transduction histidine kinase